MSPVTVGNSSYTSASQQSNSERVAKMIIFSKSIGEHNKNTKMGSLLSQSTHSSLTRDPSQPSTSVDFPPASQVDIRPVLQPSLVLLFLAGHSGWTLAHCLCVHG